MLQTISSVAIFMAPHKSHCHMYSKQTRCKEPLILTVYTHKDVSHYQSHFSYPSINIYSIYNN